MKKISLKLISGLLLAALLIPAVLTGCGRDGDDVNAEPVKSRVTNVYKTTEIPMQNIHGEIDENKATSYINNISYYNDVIYITKVLYEYETGTEKTTLCTINENGDKLSEMDISINADDFFTDREKTENTSYGGYINNVNIAPDNNLVVQYSFWISDETGYENFTYLYVLDSEGKEITRKNVSEIFPDIDYVYINNMVFSDDGNIILQLSEKIICVDKDFNILFDITLENDGYIESLKKIGGEIYAYVYSPSTAVTAPGGEYNYDDYYSLYTVDMKAKKLVLSDKKLPSGVNFYNVMTGPDYDIYYRDYERGIFAFNFGDTEMTELCNFINSDLTSDDVSQVYILSKDKFLCTGYDSETYKEKLTILNRIPDEEVPEKIIITLALVQSDYYLRRAVIKFNKANDEYRIAFNDYSKYADDYDYSPAYTQLNNDIISGNVPDILVLDSEMPLNSYFKKGLFADLNTMFESDTEINRSDFLENVLDALEYNDKLYRITPSFRVTTVAGKKSLLGERTGWTVAEMMQFINEHSDKRAFFDLTQTSALEYLCSMMISDFIDPVTGECDFNSEAFMSILEFANTLSDKSVWDDMDWNNDMTDFWNDYDNMYRNGTTLLNITDIYNIRSTWNDLKYTFGEEATLVGFPTAEGNGSIIHPNMQLAISAKTPAKEGAWSFIKYLLSEEYAEGIYQLPINLAALETLCEEAMKENDNYYDYEYGVAPVAVAEVAVEETIEEATEEVVEEAVEETVDDSGEEITEEEIVDTEDVIIEDDVIVEPGYYYRDEAMTKEQVDKFMTFLKSLTKLAGSNQEILDVITEEAAAYFAGNKSVEETAELIQDRARRIISEQN